ncbi:hypothetical protein N0V93_007380 [Gnomoniopsis smithogilvyi]|uniref:Uncharacterized protein n=1 Tax=Gnomoniopsis smithogilvyi TaxID=1191159 RepID=A0A9W8YTK7_9PEZI|nr:hypothetical protein N0V93_007380 [Gnomoniopsis smithogilvyi]
MDPHQDRLDQQAPEVFHPSYPEAVQHPFHYQTKPEDGAGTHTSSTTPYSNHASPVGHNSPHSYHASAVGVQSGDKSLGQGQHHGKRNKGLLCGCTALVFILSTIIAILAAAVVGLAVGTGVEANRANSAEAKLSSITSSPATVTATTTVASASSSSTSFADLDSNCSENPSGVNGTTYNSFSLIADQTFTLRCNADALGSPLLSLFTRRLRFILNTCPHKLRKQHQFHLWRRELHSAVDE